MQRSIEVWELRFVIEFDALRVGPGWRVESGRLNATTGTRASAESGKNRRCRAAAREVSVVRFFCLLPGRVHELRWQPSRDAAGAPFPGRVGILPAERRILRRGLSDVGNLSRFERSFGRDAQTGGRDAHPTRDRRVPRQLKYWDRSLVNTAYAAACEGSSN